MGSGAGVIFFLDTILVPSSLFITLGYHAYLYHNLRHKPSLTTIGLKAIKRRSWLRQLNQGDDKKGMLAVQSLRNTLMVTILTATVTIILVLCLAALTNNTFNAANHLFFRINGHSTSPVLGLPSVKMVALKYGSVSTFLLGSFLCSSMAIAMLVDANFLINALGDYSSSSSRPDYTQSVMERGFTMAVVANRLLCVSIPLLLWMFGPIPVALSSLALVGALYELDFPGPKFSFSFSTPIKYGN